MDETTDHLRPSHDDGMPPDPDDERQHLVQAPDGTVGYDFVETVAEASKRPGINLHAMRPGDVIALQVEDPDSVGTKSLELHVDSVEHDPLRGLTVPDSTVTVTVHGDDGGMPLPNNRFGTPTTRGPMQNGSKAVLAGSLIAPLGSMTRLGVDVGTYPILRADEPGDEGRTQRYVSAGKVTDLVVREPADGGGYTDVSLNGRSNERWAISPDRNGELAQSLADRAGTLAAALLPDTAISGKAFSSRYGFEVLDRRLYGAAERELRLFDTAGGVGFIGVEYGRDTVVITVPLGDVTPEDARAAAEATNSYKGSLEAGWRADVVNTPVVTYTFSRREELLDGAVSVYIGGRFAAERIEHTKPDGSGPSGITTLFPDIPGGGKSARDKDSIPRDKFDLYTGESGQLLLRVGDEVMHVDDATTALRRVETFMEEVARGIQGTPNGDFSTWEFYTGAGMVERPGTAVEPRHPAARGLARLLPLIKSRRPFYRKR